VDDLPGPGGSRLASALALDDVRDLRAARSKIRSALSTATLPLSAAEGFLVAVSEVATNALVHGRVPVRIRVWVSGAQVVCTVTDRGAGFDGRDPGLRHPDEDDLAPGGRGLWIARQLCDALLAGPTPEGFTVTLQLDR
jgi:anti-sigma regulatory factor (Ser/Thr protein kinase)